MSNRNAWRRDMPSAPQKVTSREIRASGRRGYGEKPSGRDKGGRTRG